MQILIRITLMTWRYRTRLILAYLTFFCAVGVSLLVPFLFGYSIDQLVGINDEDGIFGKEISRSKLAWLAGAILGVSLVRGLFDFGRTYAVDSLSQLVSYDFRNQLYDKLQHLSFAFHDKEHTGNLMSKATADVEAVRRFVNMGLVRSLEVVVRIIAITAILVVIDWKLALISLAFVPFLVFRTTLVMGRLRTMWTRVQEVMGETVTVLQENLVGIHVVKAFGSEEFEKKKFAVKAQLLREEYFQSERLQGTNSAWMTFYFTLALALILWVGGWGVIKGDLTPGQLTMFILYLNQLTFPIRMSAFIINSFSRAISSGKRLFDVLDAKSPVEEWPQAEDMGRAQGRVSFENLSFSYEARLPALKQININAEPGQITFYLDFTKRPRAGSLLTAGTSGSLPWRLCAGTWASCNRMCSCSAAIFATTSLMAPWMPPSRTLWRPPRWPNSMTTS